MDSRSIFAESMAHRQPERVPLDIGATSLTAMSPKCQSVLCDFLGFKKDDSMLIMGIDERILEWAGTDFRSVGIVVELPSEHSQIICETETVDCWGIRRKLTDDQWQIVDSPLQGATVEDLKSYKWPEPRIDDDLLEQWLQRAKKLHEEGRYVVIAEHPYYGILELGMWMCGYGDFLMRMALEPDFVKVFFDTVCQLQLKVAEQYYSVLGPYIDLTTSGDDFGTQRAPMISPAMFDELISPYFSARIARTKQLADCYYWHHSCGSVHDLLDNLISCGVDILNPVQTSAAKMEPSRLKADFGRRIVFWGGVDVQQFLPQATVRQVKDGVSALIEVLGADGGYVMAPAHNMQSDIPPENIAAWVEAVKSIQQASD